MPVDLRLDEDQVHKQNHEIMLDIFVTEPSAVFAYRQADVVAADLVPISSARVLGPQRFHGVPTLDADWHLGRV